METWPSPAMVTCPSRLTHRMVVPCHPVGSAAADVKFCITRTDGGGPAATQDQPPRWHLTSAWLALPIGTKGRPADPRDREQRFFFSGATRAAEIPELSRQFHREEMH